MCQNNNNENKKKKQHITKEKRLIIEHLYNIQKKTKAEIGKEIGVSRSAVSREIKKGQVKNLTSELIEKHVYSSTVGQRKHEENGAAKGPTLKIANDHRLAEYIEGEIIAKKSPEVIANAILKDDSFAIKISYKTIYNYIRKKVLMIDENNLTYGSYATKKRKRKEENPVRKLHKKGRTIHDRPSYVENREELNHWEMDTVEGLKEKTAPILLVMSERVSRREIIRLIPSKTQEAVIEALNELEKDLGIDGFQKMFKTITTDNGGEFLNYESIEASSLIKGEKRTSQYFADAYCSWQRGTNENINKMIRRFLPKGTSFVGLTVQEIKRIELWINNYPRKQFNFLSAIEIYNQKSVA